MRHVVRELKIQEDMIRDKLKTDSVEALKNRDPDRVGVLRFLISVIDKRGLQLPPEGLDEKEEMAVLRKELKNKEESKTMFLTAGRGDLVKQMDYEIGVLNEYLPKDMSEDEISKIVDESITKVGSNFPMVMKEVMATVAGRAGGDVVSRIVREKIANG